MRLKIIASSISTESIKNLIVTSYRTDKIESCELLQSTIHDTYLIKTSTNKYIFKVFKHNSKTKIEINFEIEFVNYLKSMQLDVSNYIKKSDGNYIVLIDTPEGLRYAILTIYSDGQELQYKNNIDAFDYGLSVGKLHRIGENFKPFNSKKEIDLNKIFSESIAKIKLFLKNNPKYLYFFENFEKVLIDKFKYIDLDNLKMVFCHGDLHGGNVNRHLDTINFYDFDFCGYDNALKKLNNNI